MTQLMLFDSAHVPSTHVSTHVPSACVSSATAAVSPAPVTNSVPPAAKADTRAGTVTGDEDGIQRMGDLARLVILRYQLLAKRREETQQRQEARRHAAAQ